MRSLKPRFGFPASVEQKWPFMEHTHRFFSSSSRSVATRARDTPHKAKRADRGRGFRQTGGRCAHSISPLFTPVRFCNPAFVRLYIWNRRLSPRANGYARVYTSTHSTRKSLPIGKKSSPASWLRVACAAKGPINYEEFCSLFFESNWAFWGLPRISQERG